MAKHRRLNVQFPLGGLDRRGAYRQQPPFTSPNLMNVRPVSTIEGRERGGSRPGLVESHTDNLGAEVRLLAPMTLALGDGFTAWSDTFSGSSMAAAWTLAAWAEAMPSILPSALASVDTDTAEGEAVRSVLPIDTAEVYVVEAFLTPWDGAWHGKYRLYLRLDDTTPDIAADGVMVELEMSGTSGGYGGTLRTVDGGDVTDYDLATGELDSVRPGWLTAIVTGNIVVVYWNGVFLITKAVDGHTGTRVGFGMECTVDDGLCLANVFRVQYYSTASVLGSRTMLIASAGGDLYREERLGRLTEVESDLTVRSDVPLQSAQSGQKLYIADYGDLRVTGTDGAVSGSDLDAAGVDDWTALGIDTHDDVCVVSNVGGATVAGTYKITTVVADKITLDSAPGDGTCSYRIERAPKVYDPLLNTISILTATAGQVPTGCPLMCRFCDRLFVGGADIAPGVWYAARRGDELDWDYAEDDTKAAIAGPASEAGVPGDPLTAFAPHSDDYLIIACKDSLWRLRGDPGYGGELDALSHTVGIIDADAWCLGPAGELIFLSMDGLHALPPGGDSFPIPLSQGPLPHEFRNLDPVQLTVSLEYDVHGRGVHIYLTPESSNARTHWWFDWEGKRFWPMSLASGHEPTAICAIQATAIEESGVILGGRDGTLRRLSDLAEDDCGTSYETYAAFGPIALAADSKLGTILSMDAVLADGSGPVTWSLHSALTFEAAASASASDTGTWTEGLNATIRPTGRGQAFTLKLTGTAGRRWGVEQITAVSKAAGKRRIT